MFFARKNLLLLLYCLMLNGVGGKINILFNSFFLLEKRSSAYFCLGARWKETPKQFGVRFCLVLITASFLFRCN